MIMESSGVTAVLLVCVCVLGFVSPSSARHRIGEQSTLLQDHHSAAVANCRKRGNLYAWYSPLAKCMPLLEDTPVCVQEKEVLVLNYTTLEAQCMVLPCDVTHVLRPDGLCHTKEDFCSHAEDKELVLKESGYGTCDCPDLHVYWLADDTCYEAYTQGPCADGEFVIFREELGVICERNPCPRDHVEWRGRCVPREGHGCLDSVHGHLVLNPANLQHECTLQCPDGMVELNLECYFLYTRGPCPEGRHVVQVPHTSNGQCQENPCREDGLLLWRSKCWRRGEYCSSEEEPITNELQQFGGLDKTPQKRQPLMLPHDDHFYILDAGDIGNGKDKPVQDVQTLREPSNVPGLSATPVFSSPIRPNSSPNFKPRRPNSEQRQSQRPLINPSFPDVTQTNAGNYPSYSSNVGPSSHLRPDGQAGPSAIPKPLSPSAPKKMSPEQVLALMASGGKREELPSYFAFLPPQPDEPDDLQGQVCGTPFAQVAPPPGFIANVEASREQSGRPTQSPQEEEPLQLSMQPPARTSSVDQQSYPRPPVYQTQRQITQRRPSNLFTGTGQTPTVQLSADPQSSRPVSAPSVPVSVPTLAHGYLPPDLTYNANKRKRRNASSYSPTQLQNLLEINDLGPLEGEASSMFESRVPAPQEFRSASAGAPAQSQWLDASTAARLDELEREHGFYTIDGDHPFNGNFEATPQIHGLHINVNPLTNAVECSDAIGYYRTISFAHYKCRPGSRRDLLGECHHEGPQWTDYHPDRCPFGMRHNLLTGKCILIRR